MIRRHPALCVVAAAYVAALALLCLTPNGLVRWGALRLRTLAPWVSADALEFVIGVLVFLPLGVLLVLIVGRRGWFGVLVFGVVASCWVQLATMVWMPDGVGGARSVVAHIAGTAAGVGLALALLSRRRSSAPALAPQARH